MNMFIGELCFIFAYFYVRYRQRKQYGDLPTPEEQAAKLRGLSLTFNPLWFSLPAAMDLVASTLAYMGLISVDASVTQLVACTILVWVAAFSFVFLKRRYELHQYVGLGAITIGVCIVAMKSVILGSSGGENSTFGIVCLVLSMVATGATMVVEEKLFARFYASPLLAVGTEGATGLGLCSIGLIVLYFVPCTPDPANGICPYGRAEDVIRAIREIISTGPIAFSVLVTIASLGAYNFLGLSLTKYASATHRGAVGAVRLFVVWIVCLGIGWEQFTMIQLTGYIVAVYGMAVYYGMIPLKPWELFCMRKETENEKRIALNASTSASTMEV